MLATFESILPIFLLIGIGAILRRVPVIPASAWPGMEQLTYWFLYPALLFITVYNADFSGLQLDALLVALLLALGFMCVISLAAWPLLRATGWVDRREYSSVFQTSIRWNGFIGLPIAQAVFPPEGAAVLALAMAVIIIPINIVSVYVVTRFADGQMSVGDTLKRIALNPFIIASGGAVLMRMMPFELYEPLNVTFRLVGTTALGLGLMAVGAALRLGDLNLARFTLWPSTVLKLLVYPLAIALIGVALGVRGMEIQYLALCAAVPTAANGYILARLLGGDAELYAAITTLQTALAFVTIPLVLAVAAQSFG